MRVRGLKPDPWPTHNNSNHVAPHAGAWIETSQTKGKIQSYAVAPHAGAWIETPQLGQ